MESQDDLLLLLRGEWEGVSENWHFEGICLFLLVKLPLLEFSVSVAVPWKGGCAHINCGNKQKRSAIKRLGSGLKGTMQQESSMLPYKLFFETEGAFQSSFMWYPSLPIRGQSLNPFWVCTKCFWVYCVCVGGGEAGASKRQGILVLHNPKAITCLWPLP